VSRWMHKPAIAAMVVICAVSAAEAGWQETASSYDVRRLSQLEESKSRGLAEAQAGGHASLIRAVLERPQVTISREELEGGWRCRMIKLGGMTPDMVYSWFSCRIGERNGHLWFEKSGTQRLNGALYRSDLGGYVLLGAYSTKFEPNHRYSGNQASAGAQATPDDAIGLLEATGPYSARIELPYPVQESVFDVIEMRRADWSPHFHRRGEPAVSTDEEPK
jgi:hypothetical protein